MTIDRNHILKIASLANLTLSEDEIDDYTTDVNKILELFEDIKDIDTTGVKPLSNVLEQFSDSRDDTPKKSVDRDCALKNAPDTDGVFFQVPPTIKHNKEMKNEKK
tara:strand:- start:860 stop:1177 length:318 start_codon:yes stop_codon:yes gene_type:complete